MIETIVTSDPDALRWRRVRADVHAWRGELIDVFAQAEAAVTQSLLALGCTGGDLLQVGARMTRLAELVAREGSYATERAHVRKALSTFRAYDPLRHMLCHGVTQIALNEDNAWLVVLRMTKLRAGGADALVDVVTQAEAPGRAEAVRKSARQLCGQLGRMQTIIAGQGTTTARPLEGRADALLQSVP